MLIDESIYRIIKQATDKIGIDYVKEIYWKDKDEYKGYIEPEALLDMVENLMGMIEQKEEEYKDLEQDLQENYNPKSPYEIYCINESDFH